MRSTATTTESGEYTLTPVARIDAQEESSVLPLREYLETHGVHVLVNRTPGVQVTYHIVLGESNFVKNIFSRTQQRNEKRLAIIAGFFNREFDPDDYNTKIIFVDPKEIPKENVVAMYEFFFVSDQTTLDLRTQRYTRIVRETPSPVKDQERIGTIIADVFGKPGKQSAHPKNNWRPWIVGILIGIGVFVIPFVWYGLSISISGVSLLLAARSMADGNTTAVSWESHVAEYWVGQGGMVLNIVSVPLSWVGLQESIRGQQRLVSFLADASSVSDRVQTLVSVGQSVAAGLLNQVSVGASGTTPAADITALQTTLDSVQNTLGLAQADVTLLLADRTFPFSLPVVARGGTHIVSELVTLRDAAANMDQLVAVFLQMAGFKESRTYLILLQNSSELRPTGGFIGSVAVASFGDGRMTDLEVQDVYTFDGQLKGHVDPPVPIRELLNQEHWYLRDSNWDPDFSVSSSQAAWFYQKETGVSVDGVFAINTPFIVDVLKATGPIDLPDYNDRITADNFYGKALYYTKNDFFPGSTQKKDFLGTLMRALITKITTSKTTNMTALFRAMTTALSGHDLLMMFTTPDLESLVSHYGWAGIVPSTTGCSGVSLDECSFDPLISVGANMGVNKANAFIHQSIDRRLAITADGSVSETAMIAIQNMSGKDDGLPYRTYMRLLLPADVVITGVTLDGVPINPRTDTTKPPVIPYVERIDTASSFYTLGIGLDVPAESTRHLSVTYTRADIVHFGADGAVVDLFLQKQPGVSGSPVHTIVQYPASWIAGMEGQGDFIAHVGEIEYNTILDRDTLTRIRFTK